MDFELIPIVLFLTIGSVLFFFFYFNYRSRAQLQETLQRALDRGSDLTPEMLENLARYAVPRSTDFRRGVLLIAFGIAIAIFGFLVDGHDRELSAISLFPLILGAGYLFVWKIDPGRKSP